MQISIFRLISIFPFRYLLYPLNNPINGDVNIIKMPINIRINPNIGIIGLWASVVTLSRKNRYKPIANKTSPIEKEKITELDLTLNLSFALPL